MVTSDVVHTLPHQFVPPGYMVLPSSVNCRPLVRTKGELAVMGLYGISADRPLPSTTATTINELVSACLIAAKWSWVDAECPPHQQGNARNFVCVLSCGCARSTPTDATLLRRHRQPCAGELFLRVIRRRRDCGLQGMPVPL